jgi:serine/threonine-protein kinase
MLENGLETKSQGVSRKTTTLRWAFAAASLAIVVLALGALAYVYRASIAAPTMVRFAFTLPEGERFVGIAGMALSPDGSRLVYRALDENGVARLHMRAMDSFESQVLAGTESGAQPFFSPDGRWVGFFADGKLKKIAVDGGIPVELCDAPAPRGGSWGADGAIVFTPNFPSGLSRVSSNGGIPTPVTTLSGPLDRHNWPEALPVGNAVLFSQTLTGNWESLDSGERRVLVRGGSYARYVPGYLLYSRSGTLMAAPFDPARLEITDEAVPIAEGILHDLVTGGAEFSPSSNGALAYLPGSVAQGRRTLVWVDRKGVESPISELPAQRFLSVTLSPDGGRIVAEIGPGLAQNAAWVYDLTRDVLTRLTFDGGSSPVWTPDGMRIVYRRETGDILWKAADGSGNEELLYEMESPLVTNESLGSWSSDGRVLLFTEDDPETNLDIWTLSLEADRKAEVFLRTQFDEGGPVLSPDGGWLAYRSNLSGRNEIYVQSFPDLAGKWQISADGGDAPLWSSDGRELFYRSGNRMMASAIQTQPVFRAQPAQALFEGSYVAGPRMYDVSRDGQRFLMIKVDESAAPLTEARVVLGWTEELRRRTGGTGAK